MGKADPSGPERDNPVRHVVRTHRLRVSRLSLRKLRIPKVRVPRRFVLIGAPIVATLLVLAVALPVLLSGGDGEPAGPSDLAAGSGQTGPGTTDAPVALPAGVYEAEADDRSVRLRRAEVVQVDGVAGVQFTSRSGSIQFQSIQVPGDGQYLVTLVYAPGGAWSGSVRAGRAWEPIQFESGSGCCATVSVELPLSPRTNEIAIEPSRGDGPFPVIDHIIVEPRSA